MATARSVTRAVLLYLEVAGTAVGSCLQHRCCADLLLHLTYAAIAGERMLQQSTVLYFTIAMNAKQQPDTAEFAGQEALCVLCYAVAFEDGPLEALEDCKLSKLER